MSPLQRLFIAIFLLVALLPRLALAQEIEAEADVDYTFGQVMHFTLEAESQEPIEAAFLLFTTPELANTFLVEESLTPSRTISLTYDLSLSQVQLAPFTTVTYWWEVTSDGRQERVAGGSFTYVDDRFQWQTRTSGDVTVHWADGDLSLGQTALDIVARTRPNLESIIRPGGESVPVEIYIYPSRADLGSALALTGRDWVDAHAFPEFGVLLATAVNPRTADVDLGQELPHELAHLLLYEATRPANGQVPAWFEEGIATLVETVPDPTYDFLLEEAVAAQDTISFSSLCGSFPVEQDRANLAYAQSVSLIRFIQDRYGNQALSDMVRAFADGAGCETGVQRVLDTSLDQLNADWLQARQPMGTLERLWRDFGVWLLLLGGGFGLMILLLLPVRRNQ